MESRDAHVLYMCRIRICAYMFVEGPGERGHEGPPGGPREQSYKKGARPSFPEGGQQCAGQGGEGLGLQLHPGLDDVSWLGGG